MLEDENPVADNNGAPGESVAVAIAKYRQGDDSELSRIVFAFHAQLLDRAHRKLKTAPQLRSVTDSEGAVSSALKSYWRAINGGKYCDMQQSSELLRLLVKIVDRKAGRQIRSLMAAKAGGGKVVSEPESGFDAVGRELSPLEAVIENESAADVVSVVGRWHDYMSEKGILEVADLVMGGQNFRQIAQTLGLRESKARRMITTVNALTKAFAENENPES
jgi:ECF sigma factor